MRARAVERAFVGVPGAQLGAQLIIIKIEGGVQPVHHLEVLVLVISISGGMGAELGAGVGGAVGGGG